MRKVGAIRSALCLGAAAFLVIGANEAKIAATGVCSEKSLAGISLSLEEYIGANITDTEPVDNSAADDAQVPDTVSNEPVVTSETPEEKEVEPVKEVSKYENLGISVANDYVNIRKKPDTESEILGKLYRGSAATILATKGEWVKIESGSVKGYINAEFLAIGFDAEELEDKFGTKWATVNTTTLKVREEKSTDSIVLGLIPIDETYEVLKEYDDWVKILVDEGDEDSMKGYVSKEYVDISVTFEHAISIEEEQAEIRRQEEAQRAEEERLQQLAEEKRRKEEQNSSNNSNSNNSNNSSNSNNSNSNNSNNSNSSKPNNSNNSNSGNSNSGNESDQKVEAGDGEAIAKYARNFEGNPYVYGGTSLTKGADCSGFTMSVYAHFGITIPRTSRTQAGAGKKVSFDNLKAGDLILYASNGTVNHVALYIGGGQVIHASTRKTGIKISTWNYRTPYTARRIVE